MDAAVKPSQLADYPVSIALPVQWGDQDPFGHVNNAAQWALVEELLARRALPRIGTGEVEYIAPSDPAGFLVISDDGRELWFGAPDRITTACRWTPRAATDAT